MSPDPNRNLAELNYGMKYTLGFNPFFCDQPDAPIFWGLPGVYWDGLNLSIPLNYSIQRGLDGKFVYYAFMNISYDFTGPRLSPGNGGSIAYEYFDLRDIPADICFQVQGGTTGLGYESNVVVIPKAAIIEALEQMPQALQ